MRDIKFRAWDTLYKCWFNGFYVDWQSGEVSWKLADGTNAGKAENIVLMQYTELKDKNGKEIYEGDILEYCPAREHRSVVEWKEFGFGECLYGYKMSEVIGNIYENPELLDINI